MVVRGEWLCVRERVSEWLCVCVCVCMCVMCVCVCNVCDFLFSV